MKSLLIKFLDSILLIKKYWKYYIKFYFFYKRKIYNRLKTVGITRIRPTSKSEWKLWYNCCYFSGYVKRENKRVFIKVMGPLLEDCFNNEIIMNRYIKEHSEYIFGKTPRLYDSMIVGDFYILIYGFNTFSIPKVDNRLTEEVKNIIAEYADKGILHTDFALSNIGINNDNYFFFDYGTSLCPQSDRIRLRNSDNYNHVDVVTNTALEIIDSPDYYYDDVAHLGILDFNRENVNFIIGKNHLYYAKLGKEIIKYKLKEQESDDGVYLLIKE